MQTISRHSVAEMFNRIAGRYDLLNRILSFGLDKRWRKRMRYLLPPGEDLFLVDLATGTCDQILTLADEKRITRFLGVDISSEMLSEGEKKIAKKGLEQKVTLRLGSALSIPVENGQADIATISFGIRNVTDPSKCLTEMRRILKPGGHAIILEFSRPTYAFLHPFYFFYLRHILPTIGKMLSKDREAYSYLNQTIEEFPAGVVFLNLMREAGFQKAHQKPLSFGIVTIYVGVA